MSTANGTATKTTRANNGITTSASSAPTRAVPTVGPLIASRPAPLPPPPFTVTGAKIGKILACGLVLAAVFMTGYYAAQVGAHYRQIEQQNVLLTSERAFLADIARQHGATGAEINRASLNAAARAGLDTLRP